MRQQGWAIFRLVLIAATLVGLAAPRVPASSQNPAGMQIAQLGSLSTQVDQNDDEDDENDDDDDQEEGD